MRHLKAFILKEGHEAYVSLFIATIAVLLTWPVVFINGTQLNVGDAVDLNWFTLLTLYPRGYILFIGSALLFGIAAFALAMGSWKRVLIVVLQLAFITFCGLGSFAALAFSTSYSYDISTSTRYGDKTFKIIHAYRNGDMIAEADYMLVQCDLNGRNCKITNQFDDYRYDATKNKPVSFFVEPSDSALYLKVGDETKLVSKV